MRTALKELYWAMPNRYRLRLSWLLWRAMKSGEKPLVTVVVPLYNEQRFIAQCLRSVAKQSYDHLECLIINDASTDGSRAAAEAVIAGDDFRGRGRGRGRFRIIDHDHNRGLSAARNTGLAAAKGRWITFLDADDWLLPHAVWMRAAHLLRHEAVAQRDDLGPGQRFQVERVVGCACNIVQVPEDGFSWRWARAKVRTAPTGVIDFIRSRGECPFNAHAPLTRTDVLRRMGGFDESMQHGAEDWDLWQRVLRHGYTFVRAGAYGAAYRMKHGSMVRAKPKKHLDVAMGMLARAHQPMDPSDAVAGTPYLFDQPIDHYRRADLEARRVVQYATMCKLAGDEQGFAAAIDELPESGEPYLETFVPFGTMIDEGIARFHCIDPHTYSRRRGEFAQTRDDIRAAVAKRIRLKPDANAYLLKEENHAHPVDREKLKRFKDIHRGGRCFIVGNGPSLNKCDLSLLADEFSFAVNAIFYKTDEMGFVPSYYVVEDNHVIHDNLERIKQFHRPRHRFFPSVYRPFIGEHEDTSYFQMNRGFYEPTSPHFREPRFSKDASQKLYTGQSVTYFNLQLAYYMGFTEVYLIGMDFSYVIPDSAKVKGLEIESTEDDPNHFHPEYFGKGKKWHDPQVDMVGRCYEHAKQVFEADGRAIYNATIGGHLEIFPRVDYFSLFDQELAERVAI